ncbi:histidine phosphatase family protein [Sulfitobacter donghicola]|uniref:Phosphoglycerate mutase n=1 Tax=Sulfitobacter donghicola DSW-25 = KCTC 12864 = JCM 14565 TaxID=1300350 RepID=A0A073ILA9_9RHOB|nr:histidine phosphatase family protein [Sulfitobacter donghicola]KEJ90296.1 phosphoglycerate mutase [Sulfitobacter donghicola DSW-25 = KCTC 12864 = JCM 14565]KIN66528.1 Phosphoglycerate mutase [Sulfitobacter donghicola DSW-25 = KCTC 12864 = JCM 14565]
MTNYPDLYVLRHGETEWNAQGKMQGSLNSPLTAEGKKQAQRQAEILETVDLTGFDILCSPQGRAFETAAIALARQVTHIHTDARLREIGVGDWAGRKRSELSEGKGFLDGPDGALELYEMAPNGEGFIALEQRCTAFLNDLKGPSVLITHGITSRMIRAIVTGVGRDGLAEMGGGQGIIFALKNTVQKRLE